MTVMIKISIDIYRDKNVPSGKRVILAKLEDNAMIQYRKFSFFPVLEICRNIVVYNTTNKPPKR